MTRREREISTIKDCHWSLATELGALMSLPAGTMLGPYKIQALIGSGGMGEVYNAWDTRLSRNVADCKCGNIMLTKDGSKLLDFGLAKLREPQAAVRNLSDMPTKGSGLTAHGTILGTLQYMAPETT